MHTLCCKNIMTKTEVRNLKTALILMNNMNNEPMNNVDKSDNK